MKSSPRWAQVARGVLALVALVALILGAPLLLIVAWQPPDLSLGWSLLFTPDDGRLLATVIVLVGWGAWLVFVASFAAELVEILSRGRIRIGLRGLRLPRIVAGALIGAIAALATVRAISPTMPAATPPAATAYQAPVVIASPVAELSVAPEPDNGPDYSSYTVRQGDDLWTLAERLCGQGTRWTDIAHANPSLNPRLDLVPGTELKIPLFTDQPSSLRSSTPLNPLGLTSELAGSRLKRVSGSGLLAGAPTRPSEPLDRSGPARTVTVRPGDSLWSIAERTLGDGDEWPRIFELNRDQIADPDEIDIGWVLRLPEPVADGTVAERTETTGAAPSVDPDDGADAQKPSPVPPGEADKTNGPSPNGPSPNGPPANGPSPNGPVPNSPATNSPAPEASAPSTTTGEGTSNVPSADHDEIAGDSSVSLALLLLGGVGPLLAAGICGALGAARQIQWWSRPPGRRFAPPSVEAQRLHTALITAATTRLRREPSKLLVRPSRLSAVDQHDDEQSDEPTRLAPENTVRSAEPIEGGDGDHTVENLLDGAQRIVGTHCRVFGRELPELTEVAVEDDRVTFDFASPPPFTPDGFTVTSTGSWVLTSAVWNALEEPPHGPSPYPALVTLGQRPDGSIRMVNLLAAPVTGVDGSPAAVKSATSAWALELGSAVWSREVQLCVEPPLDELLIDHDREVTVAVAPQLVETLEQLSAARREGLADAWPPAVFLFASPLSPALHQRVSAAAGAVGIAVVVAQTSASQTWTLSGDDNESVGRLTTGSDRVADPSVDHESPLQPQILTESTRKALVELRESLDSTELFPAPWWDHSDDATVPPNQRRSITSQERQVVLTSGHLHPLLNILGPIELLGATGTSPPRGQRTCMEYCGWLLEHPGSTAPAMAASLLVAESSRRSTVSRLRTWIGRSPTGEAYLPEAYSGRICLHPGVSSDWQQLQILIAPGVNRTDPQTLETALGMVRGSVLADAAPGQWSWAEELRIDIMATIRDIGLELTSKALVAGQVDLARWATARALTVSPEDEQLLCARIQTERRAGNHREVERLALKTTAQARRLGVDLGPDTVRLLQEVMEGRVRARSVIG